jgi:hypothetical protein
MALWLKYSQPSYKNAAKFDYPRRF